MRRLIEIGGALVSNLDPESLLRQIVEAARELTGARYAALGVLNESRDGLEQFVTAGFDAETYASIGALPSGRGLLGRLIEHPEPLRLKRIADHPDSFGFPPHHPPMDSFLGVPVAIRGTIFGNLYLTEKFDRDGNGAEFDDADEASVLALANWAAIAIDNAHSMQQDRRRATVAAAERERSRWARELHDETLQSLGGLRVLLASALRRGGARNLERAAQDAVDQIATDISNLRGLISELRPAALDELGLHEALESLVERIAANREVQIEAKILVKSEGQPRLPIDLSVAAYRLAQEALNNAVKHAGASRIRLYAERLDDSLELDISDDGAGFDLASADHGFGMIGMSERVELAGGTIDVISEPGAGTTVRAALPIIWPAVSGRR